MTRSVFRAVNEIPRRTLQLSGALALASFFLTSEPSQAGEPLPEQMKPCVSMRHDAERLACFDHAVAMIESGAAGEPPPSPEDMFGASSSVSQATDPGTEAKRQELKQISGQVTSQHLNENGMIVLTLDNGQVWRQEDREVTLIIDSGDSVTISRASLGTFRIIDKRGHSARFKRVR